MSERIEAARNRYELAVEANERGPAQDVDAQWQALVEETSAAWAELEAAVRESYAPLVAAARAAIEVLAGEHNSEYMGTQGPLAAGKPLLDAELALRAALEQVEGLPGQAGEESRP